MEHKHSLTLLGMGTACFLVVVLGEGKPERLPRLGTLMPNTELSWRADILQKLQTQELCSRPKVLGDLKPRARILLAFLLASILATSLGSSFCFMGAFPVLWDQKFLWIHHLTFPILSFTLWSARKPWFLRCTSSDWKIARITVLSYKSLAFKTKFVLNIYFEIQS